MPHVDGNELVKRMKEQSPEVPALLVSGAVHNFDRATAADAFLPKGACSPVEILERVRIMVARKRGPRKQVPRPGAQSETVQAAAARQVAAS
jgi:DNA-binding response OmpR family regulator